MTYSSNIGSPNSYKIINRRYIYMKENIIFFCVLSIVRYVQPFTEYIQSHLILQRNGRFLSKRKRYQTCSQQMPIADHRCHVPVRTQVDSMIVAGSSLGHIFSVFNTYSCSFCFQRQNARNASLRFECILKVIIHLLFKDIQPNFGARNCIHLQSRVSRLIKI